MTNNENRKEYVKNVKASCLNILTMEGVPLEKRIKAMSKFLKHANRMFLELPTSMLNPKSLAAVEDYFSGCGKIGCQFYDDPDAALCFAGKVIREYFLPDGTLGRYVSIAEKLTEQNDRAVRYVKNSEFFSSLFPNWENVFTDFFIRYISDIEFRDPLCNNISFLHYRASINVAYTIMRVLCVCGCRSTESLNFFCEEMNNVLQHEDWLNAAAETIDEAYQALHKKTISENYAG